jgi:hypothetical protein
LAALGSADDELLSSSSSKQLTPGWSGGRRGTAKFGLGFFALLVAELRRIQRGRETESKKKIGKYVEVRAELQLF